MHTPAIRAVKTQSRAGFALWLLTLCALALATARSARADLNIIAVPSPNYYNPAYVINGTVTGNVNISNPYHALSPVVYITPDAKISGNVVIHDDWNVYTYGSVSGTLAVYNTSFVHVLRGSLGTLKTYDTSKADLSAASPSTITLGGMENYDHSLVTSNGYKVFSVLGRAGAIHSITAGYVHVHDNAYVKMYHFNISQDLLTHEAVSVDIHDSTIGDVGALDFSELTLQAVFCTGDVLQKQSALLTINQGSVVKGSVYAAGWPYGGTPIGYPEALVFLNGGTFYSNIYAGGGRIEVSGGHFLSGPLYAIKRPSSDYHNIHVPSMVVHGTGLYLTGDGYLVGTLKDGSPIHVPCSGDVDLLAY